MPTKDVYVDMDKYVAAAARAKDFTTKLYRCCEGVVDYTTNRDPWHDLAEEMIITLYLWLTDNGKVDLDTPFAEICSEINSVAIYFFTLDLESCSLPVADRITKIRNVQLETLEQHRETVLSDFRAVFDLTCVGAFLGDEITY